MKNFIIWFGVFSMNLFFCISSILGLEYKGLESSNIYVLYSVSIAMSTIVFFLKSFLTSKLKITFRELILIYGIPLGLLALLGANFILLGKITVFSLTYYFFYFILWSYPAMLLGIYLAKSNNKEKFFNTIDIIVLIYTLAILSVIVNRFLIGGSGSLGIGGATYQSLGYISAFTFGLNFYVMLNDKMCFIKKNYLRIIMLMIQVLGVCMSGGRGSFILLSIYFMFFSIKVISGKKDKNGKKNLRVYVIFILIIIIGIPFLLQNESFKSGIIRIFQFINKFGINWEGASGRDIVYTENLKVFLESPLIGKGLFNISMYPHNLFLEVIIQGGISYFIITSLILVNLFIKIIRCWEWNELLFIIIIYPLTLLMFSGTYMVNSELWFVIGFVFSVKIAKKKGER